ncbi:hypothetical protein, partial [Actinoplanes sp. NPDC051851]|uniref:hypothetical protein n=1 Tax=Actinoplanes sp. NPDC051851 TaxID=3154753 RepID=UPI003414A700
MRRLVFSVLLGLGLVMVGSTGASAADPTPAATVSAKATAGKKVCKIKSKLLDEISGLVATENGFVAVNDSTTDDEHKQIFFMNDECTVTDTQSYSGDPRDPEDMVLSADGKTLWIADTGDNAARDGGETRATVALWSMPVSGKTKPVIHRLSYPDGDLHDAEAVLFDGDGLPIIVTKELGTAYLYKPTAALKTKNETGVPMEKVGELSISATETSGNSFARIGNRTITGAAIAPGGGKVTLRTYTDALEWDVTNGDVLAALKTEPRTTGLPDETFGEAITYSADGKLFYTVSDMSGNTDDANYIKSYVPATTVAVESKKSGGGAAGGAWYSNLSVDEIMYMVGGVGAFGLILVAVGVLGIVRFRKSHPRGATAVDSAPSGGIEKGDPATELIGVGSGAPQRGGAAYGGGNRGAGPVYGAASGPMSGGQQRGGGPVYGGGGQQPPRGPQGQPPRGPQGQPPRGPQQQPPRGPQGQPPRGPQGQPPRGPQGQPPRGPQQQPPRGPQGQPPRGPQGQPPRG